MNAQISAKIAQISAKIAEARATSAISFCVLCSVLSLSDKTESTGLRTCCVLCFNSLSLSDNDSFDVTPA